MTDNNDEAAWADGFGDFDDGGADQEAVEDDGWADGLQADGFGDFGDFEDTGADKDAKEEKVDDDWGDFGGGGNDDQTVEQKKEEEVPEKKLDKEELKALEVSNEQ